MSLYVKDEHNKKNIELDPLLFFLAHIAIIEKFETEIVPKSNLSDKQIH